MNGEYGFRIQVFWGLCCVEGDIGPLYIVSMLELGVAVHASSSRLFDGLFEGKEKAKGLLKFWSQLKII